MTASASPETGTEATTPVAIVAPVFNDAESLAMLIRALDQVLLDASLSASLVVVDDGSEPAAIQLEQLPARGLRSINRLDLLRIKVNGGHQRAIAAGIAHSVRFLGTSRVVVVLDSDGEDRPEDVPGLVAHALQAPISLALAERVSRTERTSFKAFYWIYRILFRQLTGQSIHVGNFSAIPMVMAAKMAAVPELPVHMAATLLRSRLPRRLVPIKRGRRYAGNPKMNFHSLVLHGLRAISIFSDVALLRLLIVLGVCGGASFTCALAALVLLAVGSPGGALVLAISAACFAIPMAPALLMGLLLVHLRDRESFRTSPQADPLDLVESTKSMRTEE